MKKHTLKPNHLKPIDMRLMISFKQLFLIALLALFGMASGCSNNGETRSDAGGEAVSQQEGSATQTERSVFGTISWNGSDPQPLHEVRCGHRGDEFVMNALGTGFNLRIYFRDPDGGTSVDFSRRRSFDLRFDSSHQYSEARFYYPNFLESEGHVSASPEGAQGEAELVNPINVNDVNIDDLVGSTLSYEFTCSHDLNSRRL